MAFPQVATTATNFNATASQPTVTLPASIASGDLLIAVVATNLAPAITWPAGWTELANSPQDAVSASDRVSVAYRIADGSEGASVAPSFDVSRPWCSYAYRITGAHASQAPEMSAGVAASTVNPDPDSLDPSGWATEDTLWLACLLFGVGNRTVDGYPSSYTDGAAISTATSGGVGFASARRENAVSSEDPGTFTVSGAASSTRAFTVAIRPAAVVSAAPTLHVVQSNLRLT